MPASWGFAVFGFGGDFAGGFAGAGFGGVGAGFAGVAGFALAGVGAFLPGVEPLDCTSMREANAQPIARYLTRGKRADMYERKFNKDDASGENSWDTMRDLPKVWGTPAKAAHGFDETNTLVIDDTHRKMREYPSNVLVVPTYDEATVRKGGDDALEYLAAYIDALLDHPDAIRTAVDDRPFVAPSF